MTRDARRVSRAAFPSLFRRSSFDTSSIRNATARQARRFSRVRAVYRRKSSPRARTPVKYAKIFTERYVAQEIAIF
jgi:hypothetical protein